MRDRDARHPAAGFGDGPRRGRCRRGVDDGGVLLFGGKDGLIGAVRDRAVAGLFQDVSALQTSADPLSDLYTLAVTYRRWGREHSHLYTVLFGGVQAFDPSGRSVPVTRSARSSRRSIAP